MKDSRILPAGLAALIGLALARSAAAQLMDVTISPPAVDRWMYPFGSEAGTRATVPVFSSANACGPDDRFDDRDSQMLVTFATGDSIPSGLDPSSYQVHLVRFSVRVSDETSFTYDPTPDALGSFLARGDDSVPCPPSAEFVPDADAGRPIELFAVAFRNGFTAGTYGEASPFKPGSAFTPPWIEVRNAYPVAGDGAGNFPVDASNPIKNGDLGRPLAVGVAPAIAAGATPADGTTFIFNVDLEAPGVLEYFQRGLADGQVPLLIAALFDAQQQTVGSYPTFYTKEAAPLLFPNASPPRLEINLTLAAPCRADFNGDGALNPDDLADFITCFFLDVQFPGVCAAGDFNQDGFRNPDDLADFITAFFLAVQFGC